MRVVYANFGFAHAQIDQARGVEKLVMRVDCKLLENIIDLWNVNVHNLLMYEKHCNRVLARGILILGTCIWSFVMCMSERMNCELAQRRFAVFT